MKPERQGMNPELLESEEAAYSLWGPSWEERMDNKELESKDREEPAYSMRDLLNLWDLQYAKF